MKPFIIKDLKRKPDTILSYFKQVGNALVVKKDITVLFPSRYVNKHLAYMGDTVNVLAIFAIVDDNGNYAIMNIPAMIELSPIMTNEVDINDDSYMALEFTENDVFTHNINLLQQDGFIYDLFDDFFIQGNIPWYLDYEDLSNILVLSQKYAGSRIGNNPLGLEILTSIAARIRSDKTVFFRTLSNDVTKMNKEKPTYVALQNIYYTFNSTLAKISGSYFKEGITSALVNHEKKKTKLEEIVTA